MKIKWVSATHEVTNEVLGIGAEIVLGGQQRRNVVLFNHPPTQKDMREAKDALEGWAEKEYLKWKVARNTG